MNPADFLSSLNVLIAVGLVVGGLFALRKGYSKEAGEAQGRLISALEKEVKGLRREIEDLKADRQHQNGVIATIRQALRQYGLRVTIAGDLVTIADATQTRTAARIPSLPAVLPQGEEDESEDDG